MSTSSAAKNLEAIVRGIKEHDQKCEFPIIEIRLNPFEHERLGWDELMNHPLVADPDIPTGRFRIVCANENTLAEEKEITEAVSPDRELITV